VVLEVAILEVRAGDSEAFQAAFLEAQPIIAASSGYQRHELHRCVEAADRYLLLVWWDSLESHTEGFRGSLGYQRWRELLHRFYDPFPSVEHYVPVPGLTGTAADPLVAMGVSERK
jgi:heme-degrading monooxygenase HmoA